MPTIADACRPLCIIAPRNRRDPGRGITGVTYDLLDGLPLTKQPKHMPVAARYWVASPTVARLQLGKAQVGCQSKSSHNVRPFLNAVAFRHEL